MAVQLPRVCACTHPAWLHAWRAGAAGVHAAPAQVMEGSATDQNRTVLISSRALADVDRGAVCVRACLRGRRAAGRRAAQPCIAPAGAARMVSNACTERMRVGGARVIDLRMLCGGVRDGAALHSHAAACAVCASCRMGRRSLTWPATGAHGHSHCLVQRARGCGKGGASGGAHTPVRHASPRALSVFKKAVP